MDEIRIDGKAKEDFLTYANAVIKARAIPSVKDNLKPVHRRILYTLGEMKLFSDKKTVKCAKVVGSCMAYHPHGDASIYNALIRFAQWWKMRYPLVQVQGNMGNIIGDGPAAMRYTECKLSKIGDLMLEDINKDCVDFKPNYDDTLTEPAFLPSKFPNLLCNGNTGIAVGISCGLVPHNYNEVADAIEYYMQNQGCSIADLLNFIHGPDFPTGGKITNGEEIAAAYAQGRGTFKLQGNYTIEKLSNGKTKIVFSDIPYMTELESGIIAPIQKLVREEGYTEFDDAYYEITKGHPTVTIVLNKGADLKEMLDLIFTKTHLATTIKMENYVIVDGEPRLMNLKELIAYYVNHRSNIITAIARNDLNKTNHKLTVVIGLQRCLSDIDKLIELIRNAANRDMAKAAIKKEFTLSDEQADAVLDMKLSRLSRLDIKELADEQKDLENQVVKLKDIITNQATRFGMIKSQLEDMRKICGDARLTKIEINQDNLPLEEITEKWYTVTPNGLYQNAVPMDAIDYIKARSSTEIFFYNKEGEVMPPKDAKDCIGASCHGKKRYIVCVTKNGNIKLSSEADYNFKKLNKGIKLKDGDSLVFCGEMDVNDFVLIFDGERVMKIPFNNLSIAGKLTQGIKSGFENIVSAMVVSDADMILMVNDKNQGKLTAVRDFSIDNRGTKGQAIAENTKWLVKATDREDFYLVPSAGNKVVPLNASKLSIKTKMAMGASISTRSIIRII